MVQIISYSVSLCRNTEVGTRWLVVLAVFFSREVEFYWHTQRYRVFVPPFGERRGNVHGSSMARWKARGRLPKLPIGDNWTFSLAITVEALWADIGRNCAVWKGIGSLWTKILGGKWRPPPTNFGLKKLESLGYRIVKKLPKISTGWVGCTNVTDRRQTTDRQTDLRLHTANVNASSRPLKQFRDTVTLLTCFVVLAFGDGLQYIHSDLKRFICDNLTIHYVYISWTLVQWLLSLRRWKAYTHRFFLWNKFFRQIISGFTGPIFCQICTIWYIFDHRLLIWLLFRSLKGRCHGN